MSTEGTRRPKKSPRNGRPGGRREPTAGSGVGDRPASGPRETRPRALDGRGAGPQPARPRPPGDAAAPPRDRGRRSPEPPRAPAKPRQAAPPRGARQALANLGGEVRLAGDGAAGKVLRDALRVPADPEVARYLTHGFHAWPARLHPHTARVLVRSLPRLSGRGPAAVVADPFMGGGTVLLEAMLAGHPAVGTDLNPIGLEVAWARTRRFSPRVLAGVDGRLRTVIAHARALREDVPVDAGLAERVGEWFDPPALAELWSISDVLNATLSERPGDAVARLLRVALSSIVVKVSRQVSDSVAKVDRRPVGARGPATRRPGDVERWLAARVRELCGQLAELGAALPRGVPEAVPLLGDAREPPREVGAFGPPDVIVSSPPYLGVYDYVQHHLLRLNVLGFDARPLAAGEVGSRREQRRKGDVSAAERYRADLARVLGAWRKASADGALMALMIGDGQLGTSVLPILPELGELAPRAGWELVASGSQPRPAFIPGQRGIGAKEEHLVLFAARSGGAP